MFTRFRLALVLAAYVLAIANAGEPRRDALGDSMPERAVARLGSIRFHCNGSIKYLAFSADAKALIGWGGADSLRGFWFWDAATGKVIGHVPHPNSGLMSWTWFSDNRGIAMLSLDRDKSLLCEIDVSALAVRPRANWDGKFSGAALSPTGNELAIARAGENAKGYTVEFRELPNSKVIGDAKLLRVGRCNLADPNYLRFTPDGKRLIAFSDKPDPENGFDGVVWDVASANELRRLTLPKSAFTSWGDRVVVSNDYVGVGLIDGSVHLYDLATGRDEKLPSGHKTTKKPFFDVGGVSTAAFSADGRVLATCADDFTIRLWDVKNRTMRREIQWKADIIRVVVFSPDGTTLAITGFDGIIHLVNVATGTEIRGLPGHCSRVHQVVASADGRTILTTGLDQTIRIWDSRDGHELRQIHTSGYLGGLTVTPDSKTVLAGVVPEESDDAILTAWSLADGTESKQAVPVKTGLSDLIFTSDCRTLFTLRGDLVSVLDWPSGASRREFKLPQPRSASFTTKGRLIAASTDGKELVTSAYFGLYHNGMAIDAEGGSLDVWDALTGRRLRQLETGSLREKAVFTRSGELLIAAYRDIGLEGFVRDENRGTQGAAFLVDTGTWRVLRTLDLSGVVRKNPEESIRALAMSADGRTAYVGDKNGAIHVFEMATGKTRFRLEGHQGRINDLAVIPHSNRLVSASDDATALVWDVSFPTLPAAAKLDSAWEQLVDRDAAKAYRALAVLAATPNQTIEFIAAHLLPVGPAPDEAILQQLFANLGDERYAVREKAEAELRALADLKAERIWTELAESKSAEVRSRLKRVLDQMHSGELAPSRLREIRALELLEYLGTTDAKAALSNLAKGNPIAHQTKEAVASLNRLNGN